MTINDFDKLIDTTFPTADSPDELKTELLEVDGKTLVVLTATWEVTE